MTDELRWTKAPGQGDVQRAIATVRLIAEVDADSDWCVRWSVRRGGSPTLLAEGKAQTKGEAITALEAAIAGLGVFG